MGCNDLWYGCSLENVCQNEKWGYCSVSVQLHRSTNRSNYNTNQRVGVAMPGRSSFLVDPWIHQCSVQCCAIYSKCGKTSPMGSGLLYMANGRCQSVLDGVAPLGNILSPSCTWLNTNNFTSFHILGLNFMSFKLHLVIDISTYCLNVVHCTSL